MIAANTLATMGLRATTSALAVVACTAALAACGGDEEGGPIPEEAGNQLLGQLDQIQTQVQQGLCDEAAATAGAFAEGVDQLPPEVSGELRTRLVEASANLEALTQDSEQCQTSTGTSDPAVVEPPETTTTTTDEPTTEEPPPDEEPPPEEDDQGENVPPPGGGAGGNEGGDDSSGGIGSDG
jgi:hypothetical protein